MNLFICLLGPALFSIKIFNHLNKNKLVLKDLIIFYGIFVFIINTLSTLISYLLFGVSSGFDVLLNSFPMFAVKYVFIATILSFILPVIFQIFYKNVEMSIVVKNETKNK